MGGTSTCDTRGEGLDLEVALSLAVYTTSVSPADMLGALYSGARAVGRGSANVENSVVYSFRSVWWKYI